MVEDPNACPFCSVAQDEVILAQNHSAILLSDRRPLMPGHLLLVTRDHVGSFTDAPNEVLRDADELQAQAEGALLETFGTVATYEHGRGPMCSSTGSGNGPIHAHRHMLPIDVDIIGALLRRGWKEHDTGRMPSPDLHYVEEWLPRRGLRRVVVSRTADSHLIRRLVIEELQHLGTFDGRPPTAEAISKGAEKVQQHLSFQARPREKGRAR